MLQTITIIDWEGKPVEKRASVHGLFAVNGPHPWEGVDTLGLWVITHVPTGASVGYAHNLIAARQLMEAVAALPLNWNSKSLNKYLRIRKYYKLVYEARLKLFNAGVKVALHS